MGDETAFRVFAAQLSADRAGAGREEAARELLARYAAALIALARRRMNRKLTAKVAPEDVVQSVLRTFFRRLDAGEFEPRGWAGLWGYLSLLTLRKCQKNAARYATGKRNASREVSLSICGGAGDRWELAIPDRAPTPDEEAAFLEELEQLLDGLDERDRAVTEWILAGEPVAEVARRCACSERTIQRTLELVRRRLTAN